MFVRKHGTVAVRLKRFLLLHCSTSAYFLRSPFLSFHHSVFLERMCVYLFLVAWYIVVVSLSYNRRAGSIYTRCFRAHHHRYSSTHPSSRRYSQCHLLLLLNTAPFNGDYVCVPSISVTTVSASSIQGNLLPLVARLMVYFLIQLATKVWMNSSLLKKCVSFVWRMVACKLLDRYSFRYILLFALQFYVLVTTLFIHNANINGNTRNSCTPPMLLEC